MKYARTAAVRATVLALMASSALTVMASSAIANTDGPGVLDYEHMALIGPDDQEVLGPVLSQPFTGSVSQTFQSGGSHIISGNPQAASIGLSFEGVSQYDTRALNSGFSFIPPDTNGAIGATQFMETTNGGYAVFDKTTGARTKIVSDAAFWVAAGGTVITSGGVKLNNGDARVLFDATSQKWIVASFAANLSTIQIAVSDTSDATGTWHATSFVGHSGGIADYPTLAIDGAAVYIGTNDFSAGGSYQGETLNVIKRSDLFGTPGAPTTASLKQFVNPLGAILAGDDRGYAIQGVNQVNGTDTGKIIAASNLGPDLLQYSVNNPGTPIATLNNITYLGTTPYDGNGPARQPSALNPRVVDTLDDRTSSITYEANGHIYAIHTTTPVGGDHTQLVWTVSDAATGALIQQGIIGDGVHDYFQGSIAVNAAGQVVIGYDRSGSDPSDGNISLFAETFGGLASGALYHTGTFLLHVSPTADYHNGSVDGQHAVGRQRWGDYAQVTVDPNNSQDFWVIGEFAREPNNAANGHPGGTGGTRWGTWISQVTLSAVPEPATWTMMLLGVGLVGGMARRRAKTVATAA